ncbi:MAG: J domain-containing protein [Thalassolituus sp.]|jgi:DnaJ-class molecular chaperone
MNLTIKQCFQLLGLPEDSSPQEAKDAYQRLAFAYHPDRNPLSGDMFRQMTAAYQTLTTFFNQQENLNQMPLKMSIEDDRALAESRERRNRRGRPTDRRFEIVFESTYLGTSIKELI